MKLIYVHPGTLPQALAYAKAKAIPRPRILSARQVLTGALRGRVSLACIVLHSDTHPVTAQATAKLHEAVNEHNWIATATTRAWIADAIRAHDAATTESEASV